MESRFYQVGLVDTVVMAMILLSLENSIYHLKPSPSLHLTCAPWVQLGFPTSGVALKFQAQ